MKYCTECGHNLYERKCNYCGKNYKRKKFEDMKNNFKKEIKKYFHISLIEIIFIILIIALVVLFSYFLFSNSQKDNSLKLFTFSKANQEQKTVIQSSILSEKLEEVKDILNVKPSLRVYHQMINQINLEKGCFGRVDGGVTNTGDIAAYKVIISCRASNVIVEKELGNINPGETKIFQILLNYDCSKPYKEECYVKCANC